MQRQSNEKPLSYLLQIEPQFLNRIRKAPTYVWGMLYLVVIIIFLFRHQIFNHGPFLQAADRLVISLVFGFFILEQNFAEFSFFKVSGNRIVTKFGTYTYGLYCLHMIGILIAVTVLGMLGWNRNIYEVIFLEGGLSLLITICLAVASYHIFEIKFLNLKNRFARVVR